MDSCIAWIIAHVTRVRRGGYSILDLVFAVLGCAVIAFGLQASYMVLLVCPE